jgi:hypothetical protein
MATRSRWTPRPFWNGASGLAGIFGGNFPADRVGNLVWTAQERAYRPRPTGVGKNENVASNVSMSTNISSRGWSEATVWRSASPSGSWTQPRPVAL